MSSFARAFDDNRREQLFRPRPHVVQPGTASYTPWEVARSGEMPPLMFQLRFRDGRIRSFAYGDLREIRFQDAGQIELALCGMSRLLVTIQGRNLRELVELLGNAVAYWLQECDAREVDTPESSACINTITVAEMTDG